MKTLSCVLLLMASMAFVLVGCSDNSAPLSPIESAVTAAGSPAALAKGGNLHSVTGGMQWRSLPNGQTQVRMGFSAVMHGDGSVSGEIQSKDAGPIFTFHGNVCGLKVSDNIALIEFTFAKGEIGGMPMEDIYAELSAVRGWLLVVDNGEGKNAGPDLDAGVLWGDDAELEYYLGAGNTVEYISSLDVEGYINFMTTVVLPAFGNPPLYLEVENGSIQVR